MNLILDRGVPRDAATSLREAGHQASHVGEIGMHQAADHVEQASRSSDRRRRFSHDTGGYGRKWAFRDSSADAGLAGPGSFELIPNVLAVFGADLSRGSLVTVKSRKTTCHRLPIGGSD